MEEDTKIEVLPVGAIASLTKAEVDVQIATAHEYPRSVVGFRRKLEEHACLNASTAEACTYSLKRKDRRTGKTNEITGPSVRFAEILAQCYGNLRTAARVIEEGDRFVTAQGICHDLEANVVISAEVRARITGSKGQRYGDDMIGVTANAACSKALRNAILRVVPRGLWADIYEEKVKAAALGKGTMEEHRRKAMTAYLKLGAAEEDVLAAFGHRGIEDLTVDDILKLRNWYALIKAGEMTVDDALAPPTVEVPEPRVRKSAQLVEPPTLTPQGAEHE